MSVRDGWTFSVSDCDVLAKDRLAEFREKTDVWVGALDRDDLNSVTSQILDMMWDDAAWRSLNEARFIARDRDDIGTPGIVGNLLDKGYISGQVIAISRLLEMGSARPHKQVNSLRRLVDEISANSHLFTREIYICRDGLPYDFAATRDSNPLSTGTAATWMDTSGPKAWTQSHLLHEEFDRLSGTTNRSRDDVIDPALFGRLSAALEDQVFKDVLSLRHKSIAHAADAFSRTSTPNPRTGISLDELARAHYLIIGVYQAISANLLYQSWLGTAIATPQQDQFEGLDKPMVATQTDLHALHEFWRRHSNERDDWLNKSYRDLIPR